MRLHNKCTRFFATLLVISLSLTVFSLSASGQAVGVSLSARQITKTEAIDTLRYTITYDATIIRDPDQPDEVDHDQVNLEIGDKINKLYSIGLYRADSVATEDIRQGATGIKRYLGFAQMEDIYFLKRRGEMMVFVRDMAGGVTLCYEELIPKIEWTLGKEEKKILGYTCHSATTDFRGRHYTAWYAPQIPLSYGPWKFSGLPGLILELEDETGAYSYTATGIRKARSGEKLVQWYTPSRMVSREKCMKAVKYMFAHPAEYAIKSRGMHLFGEDGEMSESAYYPYNPIELE